jgi:hypothetical protein
MVAVVASEGVDGIGVAGGLGLRGEAARRAHWRCPLTWLPACAMKTGVSVTTVYRNDRWGKNLPVVWLGQRFYSVVELGKGHMRAADVRQAVPGLDLHE